MSDLLQNGLFISILAATIRIATPLLISAMGELLTQRAGIWNLGIEGTMLAAAFAASVVVLSTGSVTLATLAGVGAGAVAGLLTAFMTVTLRLNHFITGLAVNLLAAGGTLFLFRSLYGGQVQPGIAGYASHAIPVLSSIPIIGPVIFDQRLLTWGAFLLVPLVWWFLFRTRYGLELRALGENPKALETRGLSVTPRFYLACIAGSMLTGLAGAFLLLGMSDRFIPNLSGGRGWLVVVAIVAGNWRVGGACIAVLVFALLEAVAAHAQVLALPVPHQLLLALPYLVSILLLTMTSFRSGQPSRLGVPYFRF